MLIFNSIRSRCPQKLRSLFGPSIYAMDMMRTHPLQDKTAEPLHAAIYVRVSTDEQASEGMSLDAQIKAIRTYILEHGLVEYAVFMDAGESARTDRRPEFQRMIALARKKPRPFALILVHKTDRFARNRDDSTVYKTLLRKECGIDVVSITERFEDSPIGRMMEGIMEVIAEFYSSNLAQEVKKGMVEKATRGQAMGIAPLGYRIGETGKYEVVESDVQIVRWIFDQYAWGDKGINALARWLMDNGLQRFGPRTLDFKWSAQGIKVILKNRSYLGEFRWRVGDGQSPPIVISDNHPAIIDPETFDRAQGILGRFKTPRSPWGDYLLKGLGHCAYCGHLLTYFREKGRPNRHGQRYEREKLVCSAYYKGQCKPFNWVLMDRAEHTVWGTLQRIFEGAIAVDPEKLVWEERDSIKEEIRQVEASIRRAESRFQRQLIAFESEILTLEELREAKNRLTNEVRNLELEHQRLTARIQDKSAPLEALRQQIGKVISIDRHGLNTSEQRRILETALHHWVYAKDTDSLQIVLRV